MLPITNAGSNNLGSNAIQLKGFNDIFYKLHAVFTDIVQTTDERADIGCACTSSQQRLRHAEYQRYVGFDAFSAENLYSLQAFGNAGNLNNNVVGNLHELACFFHHTGTFRADNLCTYRAFHKLSYFRNNLCLSTTAFSNQTRIGGYAINNAPINETGNLFNICGIHKNLHINKTFFSSASRQDDNLFCICQARQTHRHHTAPQQQLITLFNFRKILAGIAANRCD